MILRAFRTKDRVIAQLKLGDMYEKGLGTPQSKQDAIEQYNKAKGSGGIDIQKAISKLSIFKG